MPLLSSLAAARAISLQECAGQAHGGGSVRKKTNAPVLSVKFRLFHAQEFQFLSQSKSQPLQCQFLAFKVRLRLFASIFDF